MITTRTSGKKKITKKKKKRDRIDKHESDRHYREKHRLHQIFRNRGFKTETERRFPCFVVLGGFTCRYRADVYSEGKGRKIIAEVDGYKGHKTQHAIRLQTLRARRIRDTYGTEIEFYRFTFKRLAKWTDEEIAAEMKL